jgi:MoaA/NifB/PqqE/SkfB family radical SAM enzyme
MSILDAFMNRRKNRIFSAWQVEVTTRCPLRCRMCVKEGQADWQRRDMGLDDFRRIVPYLKDVENVVLEGWGESLLHKDLTTFVRLAKTAGPATGFVTSGSGLNETIAEELVGAGTDFVGFSLSGATKETHEAIRVNSGFDAVTGAIRRLMEATIRAGSGGPKIHIVYLLLRDNIREVPLLIDVARGLGVTDVILINTALVTTDWQRGQTVFGSIEKDAYERILKEAAAKARRLHVKLTVPSLQAREVAVCSENPLRNLYISVDGEVSPCVYLYPPIPSPFEKSFGPDRFCVEKVSFGNILKEPFHTIWNRRGYVDFRARFAMRKKRMDEIYRALLDVKRIDQTPLPEAPQPCRTCSKISGA